MQIKITGIRRKGFFAYFLSPERKYESGCLLSAKRSRPHSLRRSLAPRSPSGCLRECTPPFLSVLASASACPALCSGCLRRVRVHPNPHPLRRSLAPHFVRGAFAEYASIPIRTRFDILSTRVHAPSVSLYRLRHPWLARYVPHPWGTETFPFFACVFFHTQYNILLNNRRAE